MNRNRTSGGYGPASVAGGSLDHDGQSKRYLRDQQRQQESRRRPEQERRLDAMLVPEEAIWRRQLRPIEVAMNKATLTDRLGQELSAVERKAMITTAVKDRSWYYRPDGRKQRLRSQRWARDENRKFKRDDQGYKIREEAPREKVRVVFHEAFRIDPRLSRALVLAGADGLLPLVADFIRLGGRDAREVFEEATGLEVLSMPFHSKALAGHYQPDFVVVDAQNKKLGSADGLAHLGPKLLGIARWRRMGLTEEFVKDLTGSPEGFSGLDEAVEGRGDRAIDLKVEAELDMRMLARLKEPEFSILLPFFEESDAYYTDYLRRRSEALGGATDDRLKVAEEGKHTAERLMAERDLEGMLPIIRHVRDVQTGVASPAPSLFPASLILGKFQGLGGISPSPEFFRRLKEVERILGADAVTNLRLEVVQVMEIITHRTTDFSAAATALRDRRAGRPIDDFAARFFGGSTREESPRVSPITVEAAKLAIRDTKVRNSTEVTGRADAAQEFLFEVEIYEGWLLEKSKREAIHSLGKHENG